mmetsp:Transcript_13372/g.25260  ORF Transcript_13372/g.25260 Transcript_13372/m.25260 type:complete len:588 (+) Transcript_13372:39-1802(+)
MINSVQLMRACSLAVLLPAIQPLCAADQSDLFLQFLAWMQDGIQEAGLDSECPPMQTAFELSLRGENGLSVFSKQTFRKGDTLALLPFSRMITVKEYGKSSSVTSAEVGREKSRVLMARYIARERRAGSQSAWAPYISVLPATYKHLPKYWEKELFSTYMEGSLFPEHVQEQRAAVRELHAAAGSGISEAEFEWAWDTTTARSMDLGKVFGQDEALVFSPLLDMTMHGDEQNVQYDFDHRLKALRIVASRRISPGHEIRSGYLGGWHTNWDRLQKWGFVIEDSGNVQRLARIRINTDVKGAFLTDEKRTLIKTFYEQMGSGSAPQNQDVPAVDLWLSETPQDPSWYRFIGFLRFLTEDGFIDESPEAKKLSLPASDWGRETAALRVGVRVVKKALKKYPETIKQDEIVLRKAELPDERARYLVILRRDEKKTLEYFLQVFRQAILRHADATERVEEGYLTSLWVQQAGRPGSRSWWMAALKEDLSEATGFIIEIILVMLALYTALDIIALFASREMGTTWTALSLRRPWLLVALLVALAAASRWQKVVLIVTKKATMIVPVTCALHVLIRRWRLKYEQFKTQTPETS